MLDQEKRNFWNMINVCMEVCKGKELSKDAVTVWWMKLNPYDFNIVAKALDKWTDNNTKPPTPKEIIDLCKEQVNRQYTPKLARKFTPEEKEANRKRLADMLSTLNIKRVDALHH